MAHPRRKQITRQAIRVSSKQTRKPRLDRILFSRPKIA